MSLSGEIDRSAQDMTDQELLDKFQMVQFRVVIPQREQKLVHDFIKNEKKKGYQKKWRAAAKQRKAEEKKKELEEAEKELKKKRAKRTGRSGSRKKTVEKKKGKHFKKSPTNSKTTSRKRKATEELPVESSVQYRKRKIKEEAGASQGSESRKEREEHRAKRRRIQSEQEPEPISDLKRDKRGSKILVQNDEPTVTTADLSNLLDGWIYDVSAMKMYGEGKTTNEDLLTSLKFSLEEVKKQMKKPQLVKEKERLQKKERLLRAKDVAAGRAPMATAKSTEDVHEIACQVLVLPRTVLSEGISMTCDVTGKMQEKENDPMHWGDSMSAKNILTTSTNDVLISLCDMWSGEVDCSSVDYGVYGEDNNDILTTLLEHMKQAFKDGEPSGNSLQPAVVTQKCAKL